MIQWERRFFCGWKMFIYGLLQDKSEMHKGRISNTATYYIGYMRVWMEGEGGLEFSNQ